MEDLKIVFASNLIKLRTGKNMTQAQLADKLNYSDKSVSKWERGEAVPDAFVLKQLSEIFSVPVDAMLREDGGWKKDGPDLRQQVHYSQLFIILCTVAGIFTLCFLEFAIVWAVAGEFHWMMLYAGIPCSLIVFLILNSVWYRGRYNMYIVGALLFSLILGIYLFFLLFGKNLWPILLVTIPGEIVVYLAFHIRRRKKPEKPVNTEIPESVESAVEA